MHIDTTIIVIVIVSVLGLIGLATIVAVVFLRMQGAKKDYRKQEREALEETKTYSPVPFDDTPMEYTTAKYVQPKIKDDALGYPHNMQDEKVLSFQPVEGASSDDMEESEVSPTLTVLLRYDRQRSYLLLKVLNMLDLPKRRDKTKVNSFLEIRALPHFGQNPIQTEVYPNSCNPTLDDTFEFEVKREELRTQTIEFVIMDAREYSNRSIGFVELSIDKLNVADLMAEKDVTTALTVCKPRMQRPLSEASLSSAVDSGDEMQFTTSMAGGLNTAEGPEQQPSPNRKSKATVRLSKDWEDGAGMVTMILVSLHYARDAKKLVFGITEIANLKILPNNRKPDPYVKVNIYVRDEMKFKKKTTVKKQELNPVYNQKLEFPLQEKDLNAVKLVVGIKNNVPPHKGSKRGKTHSLHEAVFGKSSTGSFLEHWKTGIASSASPVAKWHILR